MEIQFKTPFILPRLRCKLFFVFILQLVTGSLLGQVMQKKILTVADYSSWGQLNPGKISTNGQWVSYTMSYENGSDTLFVKNTNSVKMHTFPLGSREDFITSEWFIYYTVEGLHLVNLKTGKKETITDVRQYAYASITKQILILVKKGKEKSLIIREPNGTNQERIIGVNEFRMDPTNRRVLYTTTVNNQNTTALLDLSKKNKKTILISGSDSFGNLVWHEKGNALAFMRKTPDSSNIGNVIYCYTLADKKLHHSSAGTQQSFLGDSLMIANASYNKLKISDDLQSVFFTVQRKPTSKERIEDSDVQLWNGNARWIYSTEEGQKGFNDIYLALWRPFEDRYQLISNDTLPKFMLNGDQKYAILSNPKQHEPQYVREGPRDFYLVDLSTGKKELFLKKHPDNFIATVPSPAGRYISYFQQKNWWVYDIAKKTHTNITRNMRVSFHDSKKDHPNDEEPYPNLGWTLDDKEILLCDEYDIWAINPDGTSARRLTHGRERQTQFRLAGYSRIILGKPNYDGWILDAVDLNKGFLLETYSEQIPSGYYKWSPRSNEKLVFSIDSRLDQLVYSANNNTFAYMEQRYDLSPRLMVKTQADKTPKIVVQSNPQQQGFHWGKSELIQYRNAKGKSLKGVLYYPAHYDDQKRYPMIVYIYEKLSKYLHNYRNPSLFTGEEDGFNSSNFTAQGYFVLALDISYEIGNPGLSATDCVTSAANEVIAKGHVLPNKLGLIGHSFGGYETDFIITQTNLFAAAVAGSAITDLASHYLSVGLFGKPNIYRFESHQFRIGKSLFEDREGYRRNSPIEHVQNCTTPLLSWTGDSDTNVESTQSMEFYLALRRLGKQHIMLVYPKEGHSLVDTKNQKDLSTRVQQWFDYHLKDEKPADWIANGVGISK